MTQSVPLLKNSRVYIDGYDFSGFTRSFGPLGCTFDEGTDDPLNAALKGTWIGNATVTAGNINAIFDNTATTGLHALANVTPARRTLLIAMGTTAVPAAGDIAFGGQFRQLAYTVGPTDNPNIATVTFSKSSGTSTDLTYSIPFGHLVHALAASTTDNAANGINDCPAGETTKGGFMVYQVTDAAGTGNITATIKIQDCDTAGGSYSDLLSTGSINLGSGGTAVPTAGVVALAHTAHVQQYIRWQLAWGTATSVTFALAFFRNFI